jgi:hypothetical protein
VLSGLFLHLTSLKGWIKIKPLPCEFYDIDLVILTIFPKPIFEPRFDIVIIRVISVDRHSTILVHPLFNSSNKAYTIIFFGVLQAIKLLFKLVWMLVKFLDALTVRLDNRIELGLIQDTELAVPTTDTKPNLLLFVFP